MNCQGKTSIRSKTNMHCMEVKLTELLDTWHTTPFDIGIFSGWPIIFGINCPPKLPATTTNLATIDCAVHSCILIDTYGDIQESLWYMAT